MDFIFNSISNMLNSVAGSASTFCLLMFFEPEMPESLKEEE